MPAIRTEFEPEIREAIFEVGLANNLTVFLTFLGQRITSGARAATANSVHDQTQIVEALREWSDKVTFLYSPAMPSLRPFRVELKKETIPEPKVELVIDIGNVPFTLEWKQSTGQVDIDARDAFDWSWNEWLLLLTMLEHLLKAIGEFR